VLRLTGGEILYKGKNPSIPSPLFWEVPSYDASATSRYLRKQHPENDPESNNCASNQPTNGDEGNQSK
jgi:hypothetical protein